MYDTPNEMPSIGWVRERFGIEDEGELLALLDVARAAGQDGIPVARSHATHFV